MAFARFLIIFSVVAAAVISTTTFAEQHIVGGDASNWTVGFDYTTWAKGKMFMVGDTLVFEYPVGKHNVINVTGPDFNACTVSSNSVKWTSGWDVIPLKTTGKKWYICGVSDHCNQGQKLAITVMEAGSPAPTPTSNGFKSMTTTSVSNLFMVIMAAIATFFMI